MRFHTKLLWMHNHCVFGSKNRWNIKIYDGIRYLALCAPERYNAIYDRISFLILCNICHYWCFFNKEFKFQPNVCNGCHDLLMFMDLSNIDFLKIKDSDYCCIISGIRKIEAVNLKKIPI